MLDQQESFTDSLNEMEADALYQEVSGQLFDEWNSANLDEGLLYADYQLAQVSGDTDIINAFHEHWGIGPNDEYWLGD